MPKSNKKSPKKANKTAKPAVKKEFVFHNVTPEELLPDGETILEFTIPGRPATKKTHQRVVKMGGFTRILPSEQYERYEKYCKPFCEEVWKNLGKEPLDFGVSVCLKVVVDTWVMGDVTGYQQSIGDIIEKHGIIANDMWIHWTDDGSHTMLPPDKENARVEIVIKRFGHPKEQYRAEQEAAEKRKIEKREAKKQGEENNEQPTP